MRAEARRIQERVTYEKEIRLAMIRRGPSGFETDDELFSKLQGGAPIHVLLDAASLYSGRREPVAWSRSYGKGRVFVTLLGHDVRARKVPAFGRLIRQGSVWAAGLEKSAGARVDSR